MARWLFWPLGHTPMEHGDRVPVDPVHSRATCRRGGLHLTALQRTIGVVRKAEVSLEP